MDAMLRIFLPIYLVMRVNLLGFFFVLPNAATLLILVLGEVLMQIQVRLEEEYLRQVHGEDYAWTPQGILLMGKEAKLYQYDLKKDAAWKEIADFSNAGLKNITRLAVSPKGDRLAVVAIATN